MTTNSERVAQKSTTDPRRSVHHMIFLWAFCRELVRSTTQRLVAFRGTGAPLLKTSATSPRSQRRSRVGAES